MQGHVVYIIIHFIFIVRLMLTMQIYTCSLWSLPIIMYFGPRAFYNKYAALTSVAIDSANREANQTT